MGASISGKLNEIVKQVKEGNTLNATDIISLFSSGVITETAVVNFFNVQFFLLNLVSYYTSVFVFLIIVSCFRMAKLHCKVIMGASCQ